MVIIMKTGMKVFIGIAVLIVVMIIAAVSTYNGMVSRSESVETASSQIDNQLQRRSDLIPNLVATVKQYASHETEIFTAVSEARTKLAGAGTISERADADAELNSALGRLIAIAEAYPDLKANTNFVQLQDELAGTENRIATARRDYNDAARSYNTYIRRFPNNIMAGMFDFERVEYFEASEQSKQNPNVGDLFGD